ncbi:MAG: hypothetical protein JWM28_1727, partial [Chitinophagaceae bacterium]|nr:hypothetical protein [Chitinophagaceae bacterium]
AATVETGAVVTLKVTTTFPYLDPDDAPQGSATIPVYTSPRELRPDEIKGWSYSGEGSLDADVSKAIYSAPDHVPSANPEAIAVNINLHRKGQFMLISNITILGDEKVTYLRVDENYLNPNNKGKAALYLYGSFGADPGTSKRSVKIDGTSVDIDLWSPGILRCLIDREIFGAIEISSNNKVVASSVLRKFKGAFLYTRYHGGVLNAGSPNALKETTTFNLVYRGFGAPCPTGLDLLFEFDGSLAEGTEAQFTLSGSAAVTAPSANGCPTTASVSLPSSSGLQPVNPLSVSGFSIFHGYVNDIQGGIEVKIDYNINNVVDGVIVQRSDCNGTSYDPPRTLGVGFEGFNLKPINLQFWGTDELTLKDGVELKSGRQSTGILIEAWDNTIGNPTHYETDGLMAATFANSF